jgi:hypothetical protein
MKEITLEKHPVYVNIVEKSSILPLIFKDMNELTEERNPMQNFLVLPVTSKPMKKFTLQRSSLHVSIVENP